MANKVIEEGQVSLNSILFPIEGMVKESLISRFPAKLTTGDYSYSNEQILSNWIVNDQRGGLLVEELDEAVHSDRYWYSTADTRFRSSVTLPPLATTISLDTTRAPTITNADCELETGWTYGSGYDRSATEAQGGTYSIRGDLTASSPRTNTNATAGYAKGVEYIFTMYVKRDAVGGAKAKIGLDDGISVTWGTLTTLTTSWQQLTVTKTVSIVATKLELEIHCETFGTPDADYVYFDTAAMSQTAVSQGTAPCWSKFNGELYTSFGTVLGKLNATGDGFDVVADMGVTITDLFNDGTNLYVFLGDATNYYYMDTSDDLLQTDKDETTYGIYWDAKVFRTDSAGALVELTSPASASPTETGKGSLPISDNSLQRLFKYFDANGDDIIYGATQDGLWAHDYANAKWLQTALKTPSHPTAGKGAVVWNDAASLSAGLGVKKYIAGSTATITDVGLDRDDGLPQLRSGEVVKFIEGYSEFFALVDSTYEGATSRSQVLSYDGRGWRVWWEATANNKNMYSGIVSDVYAHRLWFSTTDGVYYIPLQTNSLNPLKVSGYTYATAATHYTGWFDAGTKVFPKLATKLTLFLSGMTANETITVTYRIDKANTDLATGWTSLGSAIVADGKTALTFGTSGVGIEFYDIQFKIAFARGGTNTLTPVLHGMTLSYVKLLDRKKGWSFTINTSEAGKVGASPKDLYDALGTIISTNTLIPFTFRGDGVSTDTHYVLLHPYVSAIPTGRHWDGTADLTVIEP